MTDRFTHPKFTELNEAKIRLNEINRRVESHQKLKKTSQWDWLQDQKKSTEAKIEELDYDLKQLKLEWKQEKLREERKLKQKGWQ